MITPTAPSYTFRNAVPSDAPVISELIGSTWSHFFAYSVSASDLDEYLSGPLSPASIERDINNPCNTFIVAQITQEDGSVTIIGVAQLVIGPTDASLTLPKPIELRRFYILKEYQGTTLAKDLMSQAESRAKREGYETIWLGVWEDNSRAKRFYEKMGYIQRGEKFFYAGKSERRDWIMEKQL